MSEAKCEICGKPVQPEFRTFCSRRCSNIDLQRWMNGRYSVPASEDGDPSVLPDEKD